MIDHSDYLASREHLAVFLEAAKQHNCHILVRKTGRASLKWVGKVGYTGKRADMKAKTSDQNCGQYQTAGLVCSPYVHPFAFSADRRAKAFKEWAKTLSLVTVPEGGAGFGDNDRLIKCHTPYVLQNNSRHRHYGCVALVEHGLLAPRYVHGDYDLYALIPAGRPYTLGSMPMRDRPLLSSADQRTFRQRALAQHTANLDSPDSFEVANFINVGIAQRSKDIAGALMVNHGEQVNLGPAQWTHEPVLAILAAEDSVYGGRVLELKNREEHEQFYARA